MITFAITPRQGLFNVKTEFLHSIQTGFEDWYICMNICIFEIRPHRIPFCLSIFGEKWVCRDSLTFHPFLFCFQLEVTCTLHLYVAVFCVTTSGLYFHVFRLWCRGKRRQLTKSLSYYLVFKEKRLCCENSFYRVLIIVRGITTSWNPLITFVVDPLLLDIRLDWQDFTRSIFPTGLFYWWELWFYMCFLIFMCDDF